MISSILHDKSDSEQNDREEVIHLIIVTPLWRSQPCYALLFCTSIQTLLFQ